jgi:hypothetical protein
MNKIKRVLTIGSVTFALGAAVALTSAFAPAFAQDVLQPVTENGISYVSGGVGDGSLEAIQAAKKQYNLHLLFAVERSGQYLSDIEVAIRDAKGDTILKTVSTGPFFLAKLAPGKYQISAMSDGKVQTKRIEVVPGRSAGLSFYWPSAS